MTDRNREAGRLRSARRRAADGPRINALARARHAQRMAEDPEYREAKAANARRWQRNNLTKAAAAVNQREAIKLRAIPAWANKFTINEMYELATIYRSHGIDAEVDHVVPLRSDRVCGLHTPANLQIITPLENKTKGNRHWPENG